MEDFKWTDELAREFVEYCDNQRPGVYILGYDLVELFKKSKQPKPKEYEILTIAPLKDNAIYSVKRLSDGEIFAIGDKFINEYNSGQIYTLDYFFTSNDRNSISGVSEIFGGTPISKMIKIKQSLFTTEDGKAVFEGDTVVLLNTDTWLWTSGIKAPSNPLSGDVNQYKYFSTKDAASDYILMNKPLLSVNNIHSYFDSWATKPNGYLREKIKELARSKL